MSSQLEAHEMPLHKVFSSDHDFYIPNYQRTYAWETEQAMQLLEDFEEALDRGDDDPYFLGSLVLIKQNGQPSSEVVDGQQRLTTLTILLAVLRDLASDEELRKNIQEHIEEPGNKLLNLTAKPRLRLRDRDQEFFCNFVQKVASTEQLLALHAQDGALSTGAAGAIRSNARALRNALEGWSEERRVALLQLMTNRTYLVIVTTPDLASAHRIFSVMNARGLDLSPADIFKSKVMGDITTSGGDEQAYSLRWEEAEESLGREDFADLFLHVRMIFAKVRAKRELLKEFEEQVLSTFVPARGTAFIDEVLVPYSAAYSDLDNASFSSAQGADAVNMWLRRLGQLDNNDWKPPALWALKHHRNEPAWLDAFFRRLERLAASSLLRREYQTPRVSRYAELLKQLAAHEGLDAKALELSAEEQDATLRALDGPIYLTSKVRKYVLLRLDEVLANDPGATYKHGLITVEHVLPQNPADDSPWLVDFTEDDRAVWTHRLANLVLLNRAKNAQAGRLPFGDKKQKYFLGKNGVATFALTSQVLSHESWTPGVLAERQASLLRTFASEWDLTRTQTREGS